MFKKSPLKATRLHKQKRRVLIVKISFVVLCIIIFIGALTWLSRARAFALTSVAVSGNVGVNAQDVETLAEKEIAGAYVGLFAKSNSFIYPKNKIEKDIAAMYPSISSIDIQPQAHVLSVKIGERKPAYAWCSGLPTDSSDSKCFFMEDSGYIFSEAPHFSGNAYFVFYGGIGSSTNSIGTHFLSSNEIAAFAAFKSTLEQKGVVITSLFVRDMGVREASLLKHGKIIFKASDDLSSISNSIQLLKKNTQLLNSAGTTTLDYIDLRFGNKVYYKFVGDNPIQTNQ